MAARKRKPGESYTAYRRNLKNEQYEIDRKLKGHFAHISISYEFRKVMNAAGEKVKQLFSSTDTAKVVKLPNKHREYSNVRKG